MTDLSPHDMASSASLPVESRPLTHGVYIAPVEADLVILDLRSDTYACLPHAAPALRIVGSNVEADLGLLGLLTEAGLVDGAPHCPGLTPPALPARPFRSRSALSSIPAAAHLLVAVGRARRLGPTPPIKALIDALPRKPVRRVDTARVAAVTAAFARLMPWVPGQGACLHRAFLLLFMLRCAGADAVWVFGVRTWPFSAHCWLQVGDAVLDDDPERVSRYTPIMAV
ncbi:MAG TPA: lasso peptide biosynthesis B2 protein [Brevundimonas sp.]|uniref:lasso peptide biosynthesis B2 protein n=3 Tax=Brevundimonas sp. TaxID=1871086 RepID=UPI000E8047FA|nr:lasso peptide biosynthesis B2 protein [Brevundimonas sp.]HBI18704.1 lasso peptide biosynthesis B2 protein [Brevundimonas sp.]